VLGGLLPPGGQMGGVGGCDKLSPPQNLFFVFVFGCASTLQSGALNPHVTLPQSPSFQIQSPKKKGPEVLNPGVNLRSSPRLEVSRKAKNPRVKGGESGIWGSRPAQGPALTSTERYNGVDAKGTEKR